MSDRPKSPDMLGRIETHSSLYDKLTPDLRRQLDRAVVDHTPSGYRALFEKFHLADHDVSFMAFYRYARRIRLNAALVEFAELTHPDGPDLDKLLPQLVGHRLFDACFDEETSPNVLHRLADAYRLASQTDMAHRRFAARLEDEQRNARSRETDQLLQAANQIAKAQATENHIQARVAEAAKAFFRNVPDPTPVRAPAAARGADVQGPHSAPAHSRTRPSDRPSPPAPESDSSFILPPSSFQPARSDPTQHSALVAQHSSPPGPAPPVPAGRSSLSLSQRRAEHRRERRRERHRRRRR